MWYLKLIVIVVAKDPVTTLMLYTTVTCTFQLNVIAICSDFDSQPYTVEIGVAYGILLLGLVAWLQTVTNCDLSYNYHNTNLLE